MHMMIINGSPRVQKYSNTEKIIDSFIKGLVNKGVKAEKYAISNRGSWEQIREAYLNSDEILIALPLFVECVPGLLLEFLETLPKKDANTRMSFILQGGFSEGSQLRCGEEFLKKLPGMLGLCYGGCLVKGDNFSIRIHKGVTLEKILTPYERMGEVFVEKGGFDCEEAKKFTGAEYFALPMRLLLQLIFKTGAKKMFANAAAEWGCKEPLDAKPLAEG